MSIRQTIMTALLGFLAVWALSCKEGIDDWNSSARVSGFVYTDGQHTRGVEGVTIVIESDDESSVPYKGPDRTVETDGNGHFEGHVFLGYENGSYNYLADLRVAYFIADKYYAIVGVSVGPGSDFVLPPVDTTMFSYIFGGQ